MTMTTALWDACYIHGRAWAVRDGHAGTGKPQPEQHPQKQFWKDGGELGHSSGGSVAGSQSGTLVSSSVRLRRAGWWAVGCGLWVVVIRECPPSGQGWWTLGRYFLVVGAAGEEATGRSGRDDALCIDTVSSKVCCVKWSAPSRLMFTGAAMRLSSIQCRPI